MAVGLLQDPAGFLPLDRYPFGAESSGNAGGEGRLLALARGLASSPAWAEMEEAVLVVRPEPPAGLAVLGHLTRDDMARLRGLPGQLREALERFRYVDYPTAEDDSRVLAERLRDRFGPDRLERMRFVGMPRGGLIVLGMLAYALRLRRDQLVGAGPPDGRGSPRGADGASSGPTPDAPLVVVDDCALTGLRFGDFLKSHPTLARAPAGSVVFAHLYSHPDLRRAVEEREERVAAAVAAHDLTDHAPGILGAEHPAWRERWMTRSEGRCYWVGKPDRLAFPWSEPDLSVWNHRTGREETGWRLVPPDRCLKNRFGPDGGQERVQVQRAGTATVRPAPETFFGTLGDGVVAANLRSREVVRLQGVAGEIWRRLVELGEVEPVVQSLVSLYEVDEERLAADVGSLVGELRRRGLLATEEGATGGPEGRRGPGGG